jgi:anti-anti-sigma factor
MNDDQHVNRGFEIVAERPSQKAILLRVTGDLDLWTSVSLMESIIAANAEHPELIAVDLSDAKDIDAAWLRVLEEGAHLLEGAGVHFAVICPSGHELADIPQLACLHHVLNVHESTEDALRPWLDEAGELPAGV